MAHRKVDVDEIIGDEEGFLEEVKGLSVLELLGLAQQRIGQATENLSRGFQVRLI